MRTIQISSLLFFAVYHVVALENAMKAREQAKPFYLKDIHVGGITFPVTPVTVIILLLFLYVLQRNIGFGSSPTATASHILLDGEHAKEKLEGMRKEIGQDYQKFVEYSRQHSKCPSGKSVGGKLGTFKQGQMVPPFDKAVFDPKNKVGEVIGPIQTNFGWHLIWIEKRNNVN